MRSLRGPFSERPGLSRSCPPDGVLQQEELATHPSAGPRPGLLERTEQAQGCESRGQLLEESTQRLPRIGKIKTTRVGLQGPEAGVRRTSEVGVRLLRSQSGGKRRPQDAQQDGRLAQVEVHSGQRGQRRPSLSPRPRPWTPPTLAARSSGDQCPHQAFACPSTGGPAFPPARPLLLQVTASAGALLPPHQGVVESRSHCLWGVFLANKRSTRSGEKQRKTYSSPIRSLPHALRVRG